MYDKGDLYKLIISRKRAIFPTSVSAALNSLCELSLNIHLREFLTFLEILYPLLHTYLI